MSAQHKHSVMKIICRTKLYYESPDHSGSTGLVWGCIATTLKCGNPSVAPWNHICVIELLYILLYMNNISEDLPHAEKKRLSHVRVANCDTIFGIRQIMPSPLWDPSGTLCSMSTSVHHIYISSSSFGWFQWRFSRMAPTLNVCRYVEPKR